jgi:hypothetical protein
MCKTIARGKVVFVLQTKSFVAFIIRIVKLCGLIAVGIVLSRVLARRASLDELSPPVRRPPSAFPR